MSRPSDHIDTPAAAAATADSLSASGAGLAGTLRWGWRQLTSMRIAIVLRLLLAVAAVPGSIFPQRTSDPNGVAQYAQRYPEAFRVLDAFPIQAFDVYTSVWFSSIYLLLFVSLIGCVLPRTRHHFVALRSAPPRTPAQLRRMAAYRRRLLANPDAQPQEVRDVSIASVDAAHALLRRLRYRVVRCDAPETASPSWSVSAERGYLRETGNLVFHGALVGLLIAVGFGSGGGYQGSRIFVEGETGVNALIDYDSFKPGRFFDESSLDPFGVRLDSLTVDYVSPDDEQPASLGLATGFDAEVTVFPTDGEPYADTARVNHPLRVGESSLYLLGNGYAPTLTVRDPAGTVVFQESVPFIPQSKDLTSLGVVKIPFGLQQQLGLIGFFYPTQAQLQSGAYTSTYPDLINPVLTLDVHVGDLGLDTGVPQSVYTLNTDAMTKLTGRGTDLPSLELRPGETVGLPDDLGTITLDAVPRFASFDTHSNPAQLWILGFALLATAGLLVSLFVPRRRIWVRATQRVDGVLLEYAALARGDDPTLQAALDAVVAKHTEQLTYSPTKADR